MNSNEIKNRSLQTDLMHNASQMLQVVACMDDLALQDISNIVEQIETLAAKMESRIASPISPPSQKLTATKPPNLTLVRAPAE